jgi:endonuclease III-like uncharacterized protein
MSEDDAPKSAYELAMERLRRKDLEEGRQASALTEEQRSRLAETRGYYEAKLAERDILHQSAKNRAQSHEEIESLEEEHRRERERLVAERDRRLEEIRGD